MTGYWPFWAGGLALAGVMLVHWVAVRRTMSVSSRFTALVDRLRWGDPAPVDAMTAEELRDALLEATRAEAGAGAAAVAPSPALPAAPGATALRPAQGTATHVLFLSGLVAGGFLGALAGGTFGVTALVRGEGLPALTGGSSAGQAAVLLLGGALVGFGTRMAGGCTSGHGLCGVSRLQPGSLLATVAFFGVGVAVSLLLGALV